MGSSDGFTPVFVSYHQFQVVAGAEPGDHLDLYTVGDDLVQVTGRTQLAVLTGPHTGPVAVRLTVHPSPPPDDVTGWDACAETTLWSPEGRVTVCGLMGDCPEPLRDVATGRPGLLRVRVHARDRRTDNEPAARETAERYQVSVWPVEVDAGFRTVLGDDLPAAGWVPNTARAAEWAMVRLVTLANPSPQEVALRRSAAGISDGPVRPPTGRVTVERRRQVSAVQAAELLGRPPELFGATVDGDDLVLPAGAIEVRLRPEPSPDGFVARWRWRPQTGSTTTVPDLDDSTVEVRLTPDVATHTAALGVTHRGVQAPDAILLGLIWDHLLDGALTTDSGARPPRHPWEPVFAERAARAAAEAAAARRRQHEHEARRWGGVPPSDRLRALPANAIGLARLDRPLLDALAHAAPDVQRVVARWAARRACTAAGLTPIGWIAPALAALDRGDPLPPPFDDDHHAWERLRADDQVPDTTVTIPNGTPNCSQQAIALPAIRAATHDDPLAAAVDTVYFAALTYGDNHRDLLTAARATLATLGSSR